MGALRSSGAERNTLLAYLDKIARQALAIAVKGTGGGIAWLQGGNSFGAPGVFGTNDNNPINVRTNGATVAVFDTSGDFVPPADATGSIGLNGTRWNLIRGKTITSGDLHLQDHPGEAHVVLREASIENGLLHLYDMKTGKLFRFKLEEIPIPEGFEKPRQDIHHQGHVENLKAAIAQMLHGVSLGDLAASFADSLAAASVDSKSARAEEAQWNSALSLVQKQLAQHQDMKLGDHVDLRNKVHDPILFHLDALKALAEKHETDEAAAAAAPPPEASEETPEVDDADVDVDDATHEDSDE